MRTHYYPKCINKSLASRYSSTGFELNIRVVGNICKYYISMNISIHFQGVCLSDCLNYETVHIKSDIDLLTRHKANITQI